MRRVFILASVLSVMLGAIQLGVASSPASAAPDKKATVTTWDSCEEEIDGVLGLVTICDSGRSVSTGVESGSGRSCYSETYEDHPELNYRQCFSGNGQLIVNKDGTVQVFRTRSSGWYQLADGPVCEVASEHLAIGGIVFKSEDTDSCNP